MAGRPISGTVIVAPGSVHASVAVDVLGDELLERDETFTVELSNPTDAAILDPTGVGTILDDELCPGVNLLANPGAELALVAGEIPSWTEVAGDAWQRWPAPPAPAEGEASFYAGLADAEGLAELVQEVDLAPYAATIATGEQLFRFEGAVRTLSETPPDTARIVVEYLDASGAAALETWDSGDVTSPSDWTILSDERAVPVGTASARVQLIAALSAGDTVDGFFDALSLRALRTAELSIDDRCALEAPVDAVFTVTLSCPVDHEVTASWATADGSALAGEDYEAASGTATIPAGETDVPLPVRLLADSVAEDEESFEVDLEAATPDSIALIDPIGVGAIYEESACAAEPLGLASDFDVFILESIQQNGTDAEGRVAAGTSAQLSSYSVGFGLSGDAGDVLVVGTDLIFQGGTVSHGDVVYGTSVSQVSLTVPHGTVRQGTPIDFASVGAWLRARSTALGALPPNGTTDIPPWHSISMSGSDPDLDVFTVPASSLSAANSLTITAPAGSSVLVNVTGTSAVAQYMGFSLNGVPRDHVVYNFPEATSLVLQGVGFEGSVLAPRAAVQFHNGQLNGTLVGKTLQGNGQSNHSIFGGCLPPTGGGN